MRFGYLQVYDEVNWVEYQIDMAMLLCDELLITEGSQFVAFPDIPERSTDGTLDVISDKIKEYPGRIVCNGTIRASKNYRKNQCDNFNRALGFCDVGDYFIALDTDEFYFNEHIDSLNELMKEGKGDVLGSYGYSFAFGFKWRFIQNNVNIDGRRHILKKTANLIFVPTHRPKNFGPVEIIDKKHIGMFHYKWVKPTKRMLIRHKTSGFHPNMLKWFEENWNKIELKNNDISTFYGGTFMLEKYNGKHPEILYKHPWKNINDVRKV